MRLGLSSYASRGVGTRAARRFLGYLLRPREQALLESCIPTASEVGMVAAPGTTNVGLSVADGWLPQCTVNGKG
jgi:hypothetical protein